MRIARTSAALIAALLLAFSLPATVAAQSAGDEQYEDPLGGGGGGSGGGGGGSGGSGGSGGGSGGSGGGGDASTARADDDAGARGAQADELPRTGWDVLIPAYTGMALLLVGMVAYRLSRPSLD